MPFHIVGEKILTRGDRMPEDWAIFGTTGYDYLNSLNGIFVDTRNAKRFDDLCAKFVGAKTYFPDMVYEKKRLVSQVTMAGEINALGHYLNNISAVEVPFGEKVWGQTGIRLPEGIIGNVFNVLTGEQVNVIRLAERRVLALADIFASFPVAMPEVKMDSGEK